MSNIIDSIQLSGVTYGIKGSGGTETIELTQAQYDALAVKDPNTFYVITDATAGDLTNYYTKSETSGATQISTALNAKADTATTYTKTEVDNAITAATSTKQDTLVSGTNIKTINNESILGSGNITIEGGGSITVDQTFDRDSSNAIANSAVTRNTVGTYMQATVTGNKMFLQAFDQKGYGINNLSIGFSQINNKPILKTYNNLYQLTNFSLVETSAITTSITSSSTDSEIPSAKAVYDQLGGLKLVKLSQSEYDSLATKDNSTLYVIVN